MPARMLPFNSYSIRSNNDTSSSELKNKWSAYVTLYGTINDLLKAIVKNCYKSQAKVNHVTNTRRDKQRSFRLFSCFVFTLEKYNVGEWKMCSTIWSEVSFRCPYTRHMSLILLKGVIYSICHECQEKNESKTKQQYIPITLVSYNPKQGKLSMILCNTNKPSSGNFICSGGFCCVWFRNILTELPNRLDKFMLANVRH